MPVFSTIKWDIFCLKELKKFINQELLQSKKILINKYSYFNWISSDLQFILDTNGILYQDLDSLLWIQKQYKSTSPELKNKIETISKIWFISDLNLEKILKEYNIYDIIKLVFKLPKEQGLLKDYEVINRILKEK